MEKINELKEKLLEINSLSAAGAVLNWDQATYMPPMGAENRGAQMAALSKVVHEKRTSPELEKLLEELRPYEESLPYESDDASLIRIARQDFERDVRIPPEKAAAFAAHSAKSFSVWAKARPENDFSSVRPYLEKTLDFSRELAGYFPGYDHIADPLIDFSDPGMKASSIRAIFSALREQLVPIVQAITTQPLADDSFLRLHYPEDKQLAFSIAVIKDYGYDFQRGRQDKTHHPFMTKFGHGDIRITTRVDEYDLGNAMFSTLHEAGHALYEMGIAAHLDGTPLSSGTSAGVHESQSRMWENIVGRSRNFWERYYPSLQSMFPSQLGNVSQDQFYRAINKVQRSLIRTEADEVTYNLHVMMRFEFELQMLEGTLAVKDLPEAWRARFEQDFGIRVPDDKDGAMQDVHWYAGLIGGAFQGYTLGNILSALFYNEALKSHPEIPEEIRNGRFGVLHNWLKENIYQHGRKFTTDELLQRITGGALTIDPYIAYLRRKYGELYSL